MRPNDDLGGFRPTYGVELLYVEPPIFHKREVLQAIRRRSSSALPLDDNWDEGLLAFVHPDHVVTYSDGRAPAQTLVAITREPPTGELIESALQQSWKFRNAREVIDLCTSAVLVTDIMAANLPYRERFNLFSAVLLAVMDVAPPDAIHWQPSQQIVQPSTYLSAATGSEKERFCSSGVNVRLFNITGSEGEMVMDTIGLAALGLPDIQCYFRKLEPRTVAGVLYSLAAYMLENGDVIETGHTVEGIEPGSKWHCQHEASLVPPNREVIDIDPGGSNAAGARNCDTA